MPPHNRNKTRKNNKHKIEHHHLLLRVETAVCPLEEDKGHMEKLIREIVGDIDMAPLGNTEVFYVNMPKYNEGLTAVQVIQTSHIAFHFWRNPDKAILQCSRSHCLLQMDVYTCGKLRPSQIATILQALSRFNPTHADITLLNRRWSLKLEKHDTWDGDTHPSWAEWIRKQF